MTNVVNGQGRRRGVVTLLLVSVAWIGAGCAAEDAPSDVQTVTSRLNTNFVDSSSFFSDANRWNVSGSYQTIRYPDVTGDVRTDVCGRRDDGVWCAVDDGSTNLINPTLWSSLFTNANGWNAAGYYSTIQFPDLNNDGKADICGRGPNAPGGTAPGIFCALSNGATAFGTPTKWTSGYSDASGWNSPQYYSTIQFPDLNNDGKADVCGRAPGGINCALSTGTNFGTALPTTWSSLFSDAHGWNTANYYSTVHFPDLNGDGKADVCGRGKDASGNVRVWCGLSNGTTGFSTPTAWNTTFGDPSWDDVQYYSTIQFADVNNDGKDDLCGRGPGGGAGSTIGIWCALSNGSNGFGTPTLWTTLIGDSTWTAPQNYSTIKVAKGMVCGRGSDGIHCAYSNGGSFPYELLESSNESDANGWTTAPYYSTIAITRDYKLSARGNMGIWSAPASRDNLSIVTAADANARRTALITKVWGRSTIDTVQGVDTDTTLGITALDGLTLPAGTTVHRYQINIANQLGGSVAGLVDHYVPAGSPKRVVVLSPGHGPGTSDCNYGQLPSETAQLVVDLLNEGYGVLASFMPAISPVDCRGIGVHPTLFVGGNRPAGAVHPYVYFLDQIRRSLNYAIAHFGYTRVDMAGLSGGGWTTTVYSALDTRIQTSVQIAGSEPRYMRAWTEKGDPEQDNDLLAGNDFFSFASGRNLIYTSYKDLYVLGAFGNGRRQVQVLNRNDDCCFGPGQYIGEVLPWNQAARGHELEVRGRMAALGQGSWRLEINEALDSCTVAGTCPNAPAGHEVSRNTRVNIVLNELNGSSPFISAPKDTTGGSDTEALMRGMNTDLLRNVNGSWSDSGLQMTGTPGALTGAVNTVDAFYRDPSNTPVHAFFNVSSWHPTSDIGGTIMSDPVATSWGAGRLDMMAIGTDYHLYHWWTSGGAWTIEQVGTGSALAVGQPALTTWGPNRLDVFFRGIDNQLYHSFTTTGSAPYTTESISVGLPGQVMKNFPAATSAGGSLPTLYAHVVGTNNHVYQLEQVNGGSWTTQDVSIASGSTATPVWGTPSAYRNPTSGSITIFARVGTNNDLGSFATPVSSWVFTDRGTNPVNARPFIGSPVNNGFDAFLLDNSEAAWQWNFTASSPWTSVGGYIDR